jgi:hypothetical protein
MKKKGNSKITIHRETLRGLAPSQLDAPELGKVAGGWKCTGCVSGCGDVV